MHSLELKKTQSLVDRAISLEIFRSKLDVDSSLKFFRGHVDVLNDIGVHSIASSKPVWVGSETSVLIGFSLDETMVAGARIQISSNVRNLPVFEALRDLEYNWSLYESTLPSQPVIGELCGLWSSRAARENGIGAIHLVRTAVAVSRVLDLSALVSLCAQYTLPVAKHVGFKQRVELGGSQGFPYPREDMRAYTMHLDDLESLSGASNESISEIGGLKLVEGEKVSMLKGTSKMFCTIKHVTL